MTYVCLWSPDWSTGEGLGSERAAELSAVLAEVAPRVRVEPRRVWVDGRGFDAGELARALVGRLGAEGVAEGRVGVGVAAVPIAAELATRAGAAEPAARPRAAEPTMRPETAEPAVRPKTAEPAARAEAEDSAARAEVAKVAEHVGATAGGPVHGGDPIHIVEPGTERAFLAPLPLIWLEPDPKVLTLLEGVGIQSCGELAALEREAVEVRLGAEGVRLWRLARADDPRRLFRPVPPERPHASLDFVDYVVTDPERLIFTANALLGRVCAALRERGEHARRLALSLSLANGESWSRTLRPGRPTASRTVWLRLARAVLERLTVPDSVSGMAVEVEATEPATARQGDLFDAGFATAGAVEAAVLRLLESQGEVVVRPETDAHPLAERRTRWAAAPLPDSAASAPARPKTKPGKSGGPGEPTKPKPEMPEPVELGKPEAGNLRAGNPQSWTSEPEEAGLDAVGAALTLQLLPQPREVRVETAERRGHAVPARYRDGGGWRKLITTMGPDRISGGQGGATPYAREYFRAVRSDGVMVWLYRDALRDAWHLHGWWD